METGLRALDELGEPLPHDPGKAAAGHRAGADEAQDAPLEQRAAAGSYRTARTLRVIEILRILAELHSLSYIVRPNLFPLLVRKQLDLTLAHGHTPSSPVVLASYGLLSGAHRRPRRRAALRRGRRCSSPNGRSSGRPGRRRCSCTCDFIHHWRHPLRDGLGQLRDAITEALDQGDQEYAGWLTATLLSPVVLGRPPARRKSTSSPGPLSPRSAHSPSPPRSAQAIQQFCLNLMGRSEDAYLVAGESGLRRARGAACGPSRGRRGRSEFGRDPETRPALLVAATTPAGPHGVADEALEHIGGMAGTAFMQLIYLTESLSRIHAAPKDRSTKKSVRRALA